MDSAATMAADNNTLAKPDETPAPSVWRVLGVAFATSLLLWLAFPPCGLSLLAAVAPAGYVLLARWPGTFRAAHYWMIWLAGVAYWLTLLEGVRLAHWSAHFGWLALCAYLALYPLLFVALARTAHHALRIPLWIAAPILWTGLELARGFGPQGFSAGLLGHAWYQWPLLIQIADLAGGYTVSLVTMLVACAAAESYDPWERQWNWRPAAAALVAVGLTCGYGAWRLGQQDPTTPNVLRAAIVQGSIDTSFEYDPSREYRTFQQYYAGTLRALKEHPDCDLVIWPETTCVLAASRSVDANSQLSYQPGYPYLTVAPDYARPGLDPAEAQRDREQAEKSAADLQAWLRDRIVEMASSVPREPHRNSGPNFLVGAPAVHLSSRGALRFNSALFFDDQGKLLGRYDKVHPVMFGEYVPLGDVFTWLYSFTPMGGGLTPGDGPRAFDSIPQRCAPSICFESTVPQLIRSQIAELAARDESPAVLINVTNDGWFWGSAVLDLHLACNVFRAVENRRPMLVAANTGLSAQIDGTGQILQVAPRREEAVLYCVVRPERREAIYAVVGDWPAALCLAACVGVAILGWWPNREPAENFTARE